MADAAKKHDEPIEMPKPDANERRQRCRTEIEAALMKHRCQLNPHLLVEGVGQTGSKVSIESRFEIIALEDD